MRLGRFVAVLPLIVADTTALAQQLEISTRTDLSYWLDQQAKQQRDGVRLQAELADLQKKFNADPQKALRDEIQEAQDFASEVSRIRGKADKFAPPYLVRTLELLQGFVETQIAAKKSEVNTKERATAADRAGLLRQIEALQQDIANNTQIEDTISRYLHDLRDERARASKLSELEALEDAAGTGNPAAPRAPSAITTTTTKGKH
jgi:DNA anti-recombination protein RmuC